jgi:hypothetical protein
MYKLHKLRSPECNILSSETHITELTFYFHTNVTFVAENPYIAWPERFYS